MAERRKCARCKQTKLATAFGTGSKKGATCKSCAKRMARGEAVGGPQRKKKK